jgi:hypothetical protein
MNEIDIDALKRCLAAARAEYPGAKQIDSVLADQTRSWEEVAVFAARCHTLSAPRAARMD